MYRSVVKRFFDIVLSLMGLPLLLLILAVFAPIICLTDRGPVFYSALRLGRDGRVFKMYKLRSMIVNAPDLRNKDGSTFNSEDDRRLTRLGRFLRKTSLDETPQILNVLKGDMSIVGPRPDLPEHLALYEDSEIKKLTVRPGMTGYCQVYFRNAIEWKERLKYDVYYAGHVSPLLDIGILLRTFRAVLSRRNIYCVRKEAGETERISEAVSSRALAWDTEFFGLRCHRIDLDGPASRLELMRALHMAKDAEFICIANRDCDIQNARLIAELTSACTADINVHFKKTVPGIAPYPQSPARDSYPACPDIVDLANQVFRDSRFVRDSRFAERRGGRMFGEWVKNAFGIPGKFFITATEDRRLAGFVLFSVQGEVLTVELIGVDDRCRRKGYGRCLWHAVESEALLRGCSAIRVDTQMTNLDAVNFYIRMGCSISHAVQIYHVWNMDAHTVRQRIRKCRNS